MPRVQILCLELNVAAPRNDNVWRNIAKGPVPTNVGAVVKRSMFAYESVQALL